MAKRKTGENPAATPAEYTVVARRYRPQQFADLVGQEAVTRTLGNAIESDRVAHAYLFTGTRGVGKTTTARILAKALNCVKGPTTTPCDECESCRAIAVGQDVDVVEIDGASNRGIDDIREIRANVQFRPTRSRYKIYIIDEVHQISRDGFNALLKTLEEPPPHVKFIFATTDAQKVPVTILSRCQRFDFLGIAGDRIAERLREVAKAEKRMVDDGAMRLLARRAAGSMRDAQSLLDQALAFSPDRVTADHIHQMLGTADEERIADLAEAIFGQDVSKALAFVDEGTAGHLQPGELLDQLIDYWRDLMLFKSAGPTAIRGDRDARKIAKQADSLSLDGILSGLDVLQTARFRMRNSPHGRVLIEMAIIRLGRIEELVSVNALLENQKPDGDKQSQGQSSKAVITESPALDAAKKKQPADDDDSQVAGPKALTPETLSLIWAETLAQLGQLFAKELERGGLPAISGPNTLELSFPAAYNRQRDYCSDPARLERVQAALQRLTGVAWKVRIETRPTSNGPESPNVQPTTESVPPGRDVLNKIETVFAAKLMQIDEGFGSGATSEDGEPCSESSGN